jgi:hypothetical protein
MQQATFLLHWLDDQLTDENEVEVSKILRQAYNIDPKFRYEPTGDNLFTLTFPDGSDITLQD